MMTLEEAKKCTWRGKLLDEMTREELILALCELEGFYQANRETIQELIDLMRGK